MFPREGADHSESSSQLDSPATQGRNLWGGGPQHFFRRQDWTPPLFTVWKLTLNIPLP